MRVDLQNRIVELERADFRFNMPLKNSLSKDQIFLGTVVDAIPVFNIDSYETYKEIRYSDWSFKVYKDGKYLTNWSGHHNLDCECLLDWQLEKVETGYKVVNAYGYWDIGDIIPFTDIRVLDDHFETCDGIHTLYIAKKPYLRCTEYYGHSGMMWKSSMISADGVEPNEAAFLNF